MTLEAMEYCGLVLILVFSKASSQQGITDIQIVGGITDAEGLVAVFVDGRWGTVCGDEWDLLDAEVVCKQLGYPSAHKATTSAHFGVETDRILLDTVQCVGNENSLNDCVKNDIENHFCAQNKDAGVVCNVPGITDIRLVGGSTDAEGRVEVFIDGRWGTVCDDLWDLLDAEVVCRQLGYPSAQEATMRAHFGVGTDPILLDNVQCAGNESYLNDCGKNVIKNQYCVHDEDAGVVCNLPGITDIRLVGGNTDAEGRVEVFVDGRWGTVCDDLWDLRDAEVVCRQLGYPSAHTAPIWANFGAGTDPILLDNVQCVGNEASLDHCVTNDIEDHNCDHDEDAGVVCNVPGITDIRLVGGTTDAEGRVEVFVDGRWGTVCDDLWDLRDAEVVCRQLGYPSAHTAPIWANFGAGTDPILLDNVQCVGNETSLNDCVKGDIEDNDCDHDGDAGVVCNDDSATLDGIYNLQGLLTAWRRRDLLKNSIYTNLH